MDYQMHHRILTWLAVAGDRLRNSLDKQIKVETKTDASDLVTEMDRATEAYFIKQIQSHYPDHRVLGEEGLATKVEDTKGYLWIIDPIDGTLNFVKQKNNFGIMVAIYKDGNPEAGYIYDVMKDELIYGIVGDGVYFNSKPYTPFTYNRLSESLVLANVIHFADNRHNVQVLKDHSLGVRSYGSAALEIMAVLKGEASLYFAGNHQPWDYAAGLAIFASLGWPVSDIKGHQIDILKRSSVIFAHPNVYSEAIDLLNKQ